MPTRMTYFRPISLCNVLLKIVTKAIVLQLQMIMPHCIDESQSTFVSGRLIMDNVIIAFELLHLFRWRVGSGCGSFTLKLDMTTCMTAWNGILWKLICKSWVLERIGCDWS